MAAREFSIPIPDDMYSPATDNAIREAGELIREQWVNLASHHSVSGEYIAHLLSPESLAYPYMGDRDQVAVINTTRQAWWLEWGRAGFHLASRWGTGKGKWKTNAKGGRYATVPFRHRTPEKDGGGSTPERRRMAMPLSIYNTARKLGHGQSLKASDLVRIGRSGKATVGDYGLQSKAYDYYRQAFGREAVPDYLPHGYTWKTPQYEGLTRYTTTTPAGGRHTSYMTFRTITPDTPGWYIPPTPAGHYASRALDAAAPAIEDRLAIAVSMDCLHAVMAAVAPLYD